MLVLFETPAGYSLFTVTDEERLSKTDPEEIHQEFFANEQKAKSTLRLLSFQPFADTADAVSAATACMEGSMTTSLRQFLKKQIASKKKKKASSSSSSLSESLVVADKALAATIKQKLPSLPCTVVHDSVRTNELFRGIRCHVDELLQEAAEDGGGGGVSGADLRAMQLGLSHSLGRYKLKFSADKVDTMVVQAIGLLDELDKEINTYAMRVKEWYGWHFPEMQGIVGDNVQYSKIVTTCGFRTNLRQHDLSHILEEESVEAALKEAAEVSMGTEISEMDILHIRSLAEQVLSMTEYRAQLYEYLKNRMNAIAPNLTILVGEIVGARLISHAGSLMNLAKQPASTVQILGAEKALFRALKTKHDTPKYGLIYHASLVGQAAPKHKGKISRVLAAKAALATRVDALSDDVAEEEQVDVSIGLEGRAKVEARLRQLEGGGALTAISQVNRTGSLTATPVPKYSPSAAKAAAASEAYQDDADVILSSSSSGNVARGMKQEEDDDDEDDEDETPKKKKKKKKSKSDDDDDESNDDDDDDDTPRKKRAKVKQEEEENDDNDQDDDDTPAKKKKKKKNKSKEEKKKKKKKRKAEDDGDDDDDDDDDNGEKDDDDDGDDDDGEKKKKKKKKEKKKKKKAKKTEE